MKLQSLNDLFILELQDLYDAEQQLVEALPKMEEEAHHSELKEAFRKHLIETQNHVKRLEEVFDLLGEKPKTHSCKAMKGLIKEGEEMVRAHGDRNCIDAALISAAQRVEHYEIAGYGSARTHARRLGLERAAEILQETLNEEGETDHKLTEIAERSVNPDASAA